MTDAYSSLLGLAVAAASLAWLLLILSRWQPATRSASTLSATIAIILDAASLVTHLLVGHRPGTPDAMSVGQFLRQHPAFSLVALASALALALAKVMHHQQRVA